MYFFSWSPYVIMFFMFVDRLDGYYRCNKYFLLIFSINVHSISPLMNILLAEFIDDDASRNSRKYANFCVISQNFDR